MRLALPWIASGLFSLGIVALPLAAHGATATVSVRDFSFQPQTITIRVGDTVTWVNGDTAAHTATSTGNWDTGTFGIGSSRTVAFTKAGTYPYFCVLHSIMFGTVVVLAPNAPTPTAAPAPTLAPATVAPAATASATIAEAAAAAPPVTFGPVTVGAPSDAGPGPLIVAAAAMVVVALGAFAWTLTRPA
jgi:plastocyanin